ncbi:MAG: DUF1178 family protein [Pikeienuella sp.]
MIRYDLKCDKDHEFEAWFPNSAAYDDQAARGFVTCSICGSSEVTKMLMAPRVPKKGNAKADQPMLSAPGGTELEQKLSAMRAEIEANSDYVGKNFAEEARKIHDGDGEKRSIHGEATGEEAKALIEDGVPVAPLPFMAKRND